MSSFWKVWCTSNQVYFICECIWMHVYACVVHILFSFDVHLSGLCQWLTFTGSLLHVQFVPPSERPNGPWNCSALLKMCGSGFGQGCRSPWPLIIWHRPLPAHPTSGINYTCLVLTRSGELDSHVMPYVLFINTGHLLLTRAPVFKSSESLFPLGFIWH